MTHNKTQASSFYSVGLLETMCFRGVDEINYWYMKNGYLYHCDQTSQRIHRKRLDQTINVYSSTLWEAV